MALTTFPVIFQVMLDKCNTQHDNTITSNNRKDPEKPADMRKCLFNVLENMYIT